MSSQRCPLAKLSAMSAQTSCGVCSFSCRSVLPWFSFHVCALSVHCFVPGRRWQRLVSFALLLRIMTQSFCRTCACILPHAFHGKPMPDAFHDSGSLLERWLFRGVAAPDHRFSARLSADCAVENLHAVVAGCGFYFSGEHREHRLAAPGTVISWYKRMRSKAFVRRLPLRRARGRRYRGAGFGLAWESFTRSRQPFLFILSAHLTAGAQGAGWWLCAQVRRLWQCTLLTGSSTCSLAHAHPGPKSRAAQTGLVLKFLGNFLLGGGARVPALITRCWGSSSRTSRLDGSNCGRSTVSGMRLHQAYLLLFLRHLHLHLLLVACRVFGLWLQGGCSLGFRAALGCQRRPQGLWGRQTGKVSERPITKDPEEPRTLRFLSPF